jgi:predicted short-subunit dehydrogenase-like oxidoreductase (DUF2520 family)
MDVAIVGAGRVGTALGVRLRGAGHRIVAASGRDATPARVRTYLGSVRVLTPADAARRAEVVIIATPDDAIAPTCASIVDGGGLTPGAVVGHVSGATGLAALATAGDQGATTLSLHPLQTFTDVASAIELLSGCPIAVTSATEAGESIGERLALDAGGRPFALPDEAKPRYHAAAVFASNDLVAVTSLARDLAVAAGLDDGIELLAPLQATTLANVRSMGPELALTGPAARGDAGTIAAHLAALSQAAPEAIPAYVALARVCLDLSERAGRLDPDRRRAVEEVLGRWT